MLPHSQGRSNDRAAEQLKYPTITDLLSFITHRTKCELRHSNDDVKNNFFEVCDKDKRDYD